MSREIETLESLAASLGGVARTRVLTTVRARERELPLRAVIFERQGQRPDRSLPVLALFGGVHGLERIGAEVVLAHLAHQAELAAWDASFARALEGMRLVFVPIVNPAGLCLGTRSNANGVDLMRNAPIDSPEREGSWRIYRGHRISPRLPWYRGAPGAPLEPETLALLEFVREEIFPSSCAISVDVHSGFGAVDRLWFPYATRREPFPRAAEALRLKSLLDRTLPNHPYAVEPQSRQYTTHGDLWDYLHAEHEREHSGRGTYLPLTLEMGSWNWLKKNPLQALRLEALFHPIKKHRIRRVLRRHSGLFDFLARAAINPGAWSVPDPRVRGMLEHQAQELWNPRS